MKGPETIESSEADPNTIKTLRNVIQMIELSLVDVDGIEWRVSSIYFLC